MKQRILLIVAMLLIATPAFATVTINAVQGSGENANKVYVSYSTTGEAVRAFALDFTLGTQTPQAVWAGIQDFNKGESTTPGGGYGIFPGQFRNNINPADPNWNHQYYYPIAPPNDVDSNGTGIGTPKVICELGTLYKDANAPGTSGLLFTLLFDPNDQTSNIPLTVATNVVRGGVVLEDGSSVAPTINATNPLIVAPTTITISGRIVGAAAPLNTKGIEGVRLTSSPAGVDVNTDTSGNWSVVVNSPYTGTITPSDVNNQWDWTPGPATLVYAAVTVDQTGQNITATAKATECLNAKDPGYAAWISATWNRPNCWCNRRQCRGDINGLKSGQFWV